MSEYARRSRSAEESIAAPSAMSQPAYQQRYGNAATQAQVAEAAAIRAEPPPLVYDDSKLPGASARAITERIDEWERLHLKDGARLTVEERLVLTAHCLAAAGETEQARSHLIGNVFFSSTQRKVDGDNLSKTQATSVRVTPSPSTVLSLTAPVQGTASVEFSNGDTQLFMGPLPYAQLDTNDREQRVQTARSGGYDRGNRVPLGAESMTTGHRPQLQAAFEAEAAADKKTLSPRGTPAYNDAFMDFLYDKVLHSWAARMAARNTPRLQAWVERNPAPRPMTTAWTQRVGMQAINLIVGDTFLDNYAWAHPGTWYVEDEAAAQLLIEAVVPGLRVNYDVDNMSVS